jgi:glucosamine--fructose-6-phosphate aminotransferase (isomerizing)
MCGIIGDIRSAKDFITKQMINSLKKLEYRGYDSSGICLLCDDQFKVNKSLGEIKNLE